MRKARKNYFIYLMMLLIFGGLIYTAIAGGERFLHLSSIKPATAGDDAFTMFKTILLDNLEHPFSILLIQIIVVFDCGSYFCVCIPLYRATGSDR